MLILPLLLQVAWPPADCVEPDSPFFERRLLQGYVSCDAPPPEPDREVTEDEKQLVKDYFDIVLLDGPSARWRFEFVRGGSLVCGFVNSKNQFGAYVGYTPFTYSIDQDYGAIYNEDRLWLFETLCSGEIGA